MNDTNQEKEDEVLRRMLATKPTPHKPQNPKKEKPKKG
jgi:hypothetical protein